MRVAPAGTRKRINSTAPTGNAGAVGDGAALPLVTPTSTWFDLSPCDRSFARIHTTSMRGLLGSPALTAGVWPPSHHASENPSEAPREHTAMPAATS